MEEPTVIESTFEGVPLTAWMVKKGDKILLRGKDSTLGISFMDPEQVPLEGEVQPYATDPVNLAHVRARMIAVQELRKSISDYKSGGTEPCFAHLVYRFREGKGPLIAILIDKEKLQFAGVEDQPCPPLS